MHRRSPTRSIVGSRHRRRDRYIVQRASNPAYWTLVSQPGELPFASSAPHGAVLRGREGFLRLFTLALRSLDQQFGTRLSVYGWAFYFGPVEAALTEALAMCAFVVGSRTTHAQINCVDGFPRRDGDALVLARRTTSRDGLRLLPDRLPRDARGSDRSTGWWRAARPTGLPIRHTRRRSRTRRYRRKDRGER